MGTSATAMAPLLLRNLLTAVFLLADASLQTLSAQFHFHQFQPLRRLLSSSFIFFLRLFPSSNSHHHHHKSPKSETSLHQNNPVIDSGIGRALAQLLSIVNGIPVSSRKYEVVRSLAESIIEDNNKEGFDELKEVNRGVIAAAFEKTVKRLESAAAAEDRGDLGFGSLKAEFYYVGKALKALRFVGDAAWAKLVRPRYVVEEVMPAEKLAAEGLWLAQKMEACGCVEEAVAQWANASGLAWISLAAEPRLQGSLVKVSAFMFKQARDIGRDDGDVLDSDVDRKMKQRQMEMKMLVLWLPLLCRSSNGTDVPVLSTWERAELERILEEMIDALGNLEDQEKVLSLWLRHFTYSSSSDWPNLRDSYARWCTASRKQLVLQ